MLNELFSLEKFTDACEKILYFLKINFLFLIFNFPVLIFFLFIGIHNVREYLPLFLICLLPTGPSISAVFFSMNRLMRHIETTAFKDYIEGYKHILYTKTVLSFLYLFGVWILWTNVEFFGIQFPCFPLLLFFIVVFGCFLCSYVNLFLLSSRYTMRIGNYFKAAFYLTITKPQLTIGNIIIAVFVLMLIEIKAGTFVLFMISIYGFLVVFINRTIINQFDQKVDKK